MIDRLTSPALRLYPTAPAISRHSRSTEDEFIGGGRYRIRPEDIVAIPLPDLHRDPAVWGDDAEEFRPERMLDDEFQKLPSNCWKPFGTGVRACLGRALSWQVSSYKQRG